MRFFCDTLAKKLFSVEEYSQIEEFIQLSGKDVQTYVNKQLAPIPLARARFCEDSLRSAVQTGTKQYVILGSGFDTFALRNDNSEIRIFEIDKPNIIAEKIRRTERAGLKSSDNVRYVSADLSNADLAKALKEKGFDKKEKTFFSCLGLFYYLTKKEIEILFKQISEFAPEGSAVIFDFADNHFFSTEIPRVKELIKTANESGEPMKSCFGYCELEKLLERYNFYIYEFLSDKDMQDRYFSDCNEEITAFEHVDYALAVLKP